LAAYVQFNSEFARGSNVADAIALNKFEDQIRPLADQADVGDLEEWITALADYADSAASSVQLPYDSRGINPAVDMPQAHNGMMKACYDILGATWAQTVQHPATQRFLSRISSGSE
jgi:hypothetical protein